ncbi:hypothetical protein ACKP2L_01420 [Oenococcus alcoholitolerans]|uniref:hypothetical protein n=1 Tax=Oenococcus alcoholitolerans TaxID=931074 RepID=UPI003F7240D8
MDDQTLMNQALRSTAEHFNYRKLSLSVWVSAINGEFISAAESYDADVTDIQLYFIGTPKGDVYHTSGSFEFASGTKNTELDIDLSTQNDADAEN